MIKSKWFQFIIILFLLLPIAFLGCSGGSDDAAAPVPSPSIKVLPSSYNFGIVTAGSSPAPLEVEIANNGSLGLTVSSIVLSDTINFDLDLSGGSNPCNKTSPTIAAGGKCTAEVDFLPQATASFNANLTIRSNASNNSALNVPLSGSQEEISAIDVRINQVEACPGPVVTAYVSVTDQGGYPVTTLTKNDFSVTEDATLIVGAPTSTSFVSNTATISVALVMDYSGSISFVQDNVDDMEEAAANFVDQMGAGDEVEIIKFDKEFKVVQAFTSNKALLTAAIYNPWDFTPGGTRLYDAVVEAVDDTALRLKNRKAVIVITDGVDDDLSGNQLSDNDLNDVINDANNNGVPIFTVGLGQADGAMLTQMADDTGGQFFDSTTSDNLRTIYQQLADVLFHDQYILTYTSGLGAGVTADLTIEATLLAIVGNNTKEITSCP
jgi:Ca-activated chloride channel family protein